MSKSKKRGNATQSKNAPMNSEKPATNGAPAPEQPAAEEPAAPEQPAPAPELTPEQELEMVTNEANAKLADLMLKPMTTEVFEQIQLLLTSKKTALDKAEAFKIAQAALAEKRAAYVQELGAHRDLVQAQVAEFRSSIEQYATASICRQRFADFLATLPEEPVDPATIVVVAEKSKTKRTSGTGKGNTGAGVIAAIAAAIRESGTVGITKAGILDKLTVKFPERDKDAMKNTIGIQVPSRIANHIVVEKLENGNYREKK